MTSVLSLEPKAVFKHFHALNQIPRCSGNEAAASQFLLDFAQKLGLEAEQDHAKNVLIRKPASKGYEDAPTVILQGHIDMVCEKTQDSQHNFDTDPIDMIVDGDFLKANQTTLGADNGVAVAYAMAILEDESLAHPALEVLLTTEEETGMDGAKAIKKGWCKGTRLLNIDSEEEGVFLASCAGGAEYEVRLKAKKRPCSLPGFELRLDGLLGGHSGMEIHLGRGNANKLLARLLNALLSEMPLRIADFTGGSKHNAIPSDASVKLYVEDPEAAKKILETMAKVLQKEYRQIDPDLRVTITALEGKGEAFSEEESAAIISYFFLVPDGVRTMSSSIEGLVECSLNNAIVRCQDGKLVETLSIRSSTLSKRHETEAILSRLAECLGGEAELIDSYPAWEYEADSVLREQAVKTYERISGKKAQVSAIHAGLECGLLKEVMPETDMISFGPFLYDVHSPRERMDIASVARMYEFTCAYLADLRS